MATQKVIYFIAGVKPTVDELADIALINDACEQPYELHVYGQANQSLPLRHADFVAGTVPTEYAAYDVMDPENIPQSPLPVDQAVVLDGATLEITSSVGTNAHGGAVTIVDSVITAIKLDATTTFIDNEDAVTVENSAGNLDSVGTVSVSAGALGTVKLAATKTIVTNAQALTGVAPSGSYTNTVTFTVADGLITAIVLS